MANDDDYPGRGSSPVDGWPPDFEHLVIPDDARELDADARALARERRAQARRERMRNVTRVRHWHQHPLSWAIVIGVVAATLGVTSLLVALRPSRAVPRSQPLAANLSRPVGAEGGLLPDAQVGRLGGSTTALRDFRPAIIVLIPDGRDAAETLRVAVRVADRHHVYAVAIGSGTPTFPADLRNTSLIPASDPSRQLLTRFQARDVPVLLLVRNDGMLTRILTGAPPDPALNAEVVSLAG